MNSYHHIFLIFIITQLFFSANLVGQSNFEKAKQYFTEGTDFFNNDQFEKAISQFQLASKLFKQKPDSLNQANLWQTYEMIGKAYRELIEYDSTEIYFSKALATIKSLHGEVSKETVSFMNSFAAHHAGRGCWKPSLKIRLEALNLAEQLSDANRLKLILSNNIAALYEGIGEQSLSRIYMEKVVGGLKTAGLSENEQSICLNNFAELLAKEGKFEEAFRFIEKADQLKPTARRAVAHSFNTKGAVYRLFEKHDSALYFHQKRRTFLEQNPIGPNDISLTHIAIANDYLNLKRYNSILKEVDLGLQKIKKYNTPDIVSTLYRLKGLAFKNQEKLDSARFYFKESLKAAQYDFCKIESLNRYTQGYYSFYELAKVEADFENFDTALFYFNLADSALIAQRKLLVKQESKISLANEAVKLAEAVLEISIQLPVSELQEIYYRKAFHLSEHAKSLSLYEAFLKTQVTEFEGVLAEKIAEELRVSTDLQHYKKQLEEKLAANAEEAIIGKLENKIFQLHRDWESLMSSFKNAPEYVELKYNYSTTSFETIKNTMLDENQTLLEYFVGEKGIYVFIMNAETFKVHFIENTLDFPRLIKAMNEGIFEHYLKGNATSAHEGNLKYSQAAYQLYQELIFPIEPLLTEKLIIIPDAFLNYIPFDLLLKEAPKMATLNHFRAHKYLIKDHQISYAYSATLLEKMIKKEIQPSEKWLGIAPKFEKNDKNKIAYNNNISNIRSAISELKYNITEIQNLQEILEGDILIESDATLANLFAKAALYEVLHFSTHGKADDRIGDHSYLAFSKILNSQEYEKLFLRDLYNLRLNAAMIVLSACETGIGALQKGEGILSLARGFAYAGSKSIICTMWNVDDKSTKVLMESFYKNLKKGWKKDAALRQAKLDYLNYGENPAPFFWGSFSAIGDMSALEKSFWKSKNWWFFGGCFLVLGLILFQFYSR